MQNWKARTDMTTSGKRTLRTVAVTALATIAVVLVALWALQDRLIYRSVEQIAAAPKGWSDVAFDVPGSGRAQAHHIAAQPGKPTLLLLQGYGLTGAIAATKSFVAAGMGVLAPEYPGRGGAEGTPTEASMNATADAALTWLGSKGVAPSDVVVYGIGLGAGPAVHAAHSPVRRLVIVSGVADMGDAVRAHAPFVPTFAVRDAWRNADAIASVRNKVTVVHGTADQEVPFAQGEKLASASHTSVITLPGDHMIAFDPGLQSALAASILGQTAGRKPTR